MIREIISLRLLTLMLILVGIALLAPKPATATEGPWARWKMDFTFPDDQLEAVLTIKVGYTTSSGIDIYQQVEDYEITCVMIGNVVVQNEEATFDGNSYYRCTVPSIRSKVALMTNGGLLLPPSSAYTEQYLVGDLILDPILGGGDNPVFYRDDIKFDLPMDFSTQEAWLDVAFDHAEAESSKFAISSSLQRVAVRYDETGPTQFTPDIRVDSTMLSSTPGTINGEIFLSNEASQIYLGYSPDTLEFFEGVMSWVQVDPYCYCGG